GGGGGPAVDVGGRAGLPGEGLFVLSPGDRGGAEPHPRRVLGPPGAEPPQGEGPDEVAPPGPPVAARRESCRARARQRPRGRGAASGAGSSAGTRARAVAGATR